MEDHEISKTGVRLAQMISSIKGDRAANLQKKLKKLSRKKVIEPPLEKIQSDLIERRLNFEKASKEVSKWDSIVKERSKSAQLKFPLKEPDVGINEASEVIRDAPAKSELETQVSELLKSSEAALHDDQELTPAEAKFMKAISIEEARARHRELQKMRALVSHQSAKMKRQKSIKSKSYRRILKHEKIRREVKKFEDNKSNKEVLMEEIKRLERLRARERATLKHKNTGKWAKHVKIRAKFDDQARQAMVEQIGLAEKNLRKGPKLTDSSDSDDAESEESGVEQSDDEEINVPDEKLDDKESGPQVGDPKKYNPWLRSSNIADQNDSDARDLDAQLEDTVSKRFQLNSSNQKTKPDTNVMVIEEEVHEIADDDQSMSDVDDEQRKLMGEAFAGDDVVEEFEKAKLELADEEQPKDLDLYLPGWGGWAGPGIKTNSKRKSKYLIKAKKLSRRDDKLGNVIISEKADGKIKQYMVKKLPHPLRNESQLQQKIRDPATSSFRDQVSLREKVKPRVVTRLGAKIDPMDETELRRRSDRVKFDV